MRTCDGKGGGGGGGDPDDVALGVQGHRAGRDRVANAAPHTQLPRSTVPAHHHATRVCRRTNKAHCQLKFEAGAGVDGGGGSGGRQQAATWACGILTTTQNSKKRVPGRFPPPHTTSHQSRYAPQNQNCAGWWVPAVTGIIPPKQQKRRAAGTWSPPIPSSPRSKTVWSLATAVATKPVSMDGEVGGWWAPPLGAPTATVTGWRRPASSPVPSRPLQPRPNANVRWDRPAGTTEGPQ